MSNESTPTPADGWGEDEEIVIEVVDVSTVAASLGYVWPVQLSVALWNCLKGDPHDRQPSLPIILRLLQSVLRRMLTIPPEAAQETTHITHQHDEQTLLIVVDTRERVRADGDCELYPVLMILLADD